MRSKMALSALLAVAVASALFIGGCGGKTQEAAKPGEKKLEEKIVVYSPHSKDILQYYAQKFEKEKGVKVEWLFLGSQEVYDRIKSEKDNPQADIFFGGPAYMHMMAKKDGLLQPYKPSWADTIEPAFKDNENYWFSNWKNVVVMFYNNRLVKPEDAPKAWRDLADPKWSGKVVTRYPLSSGSLRVLYSALVYQDYKKDKDPKAGYEFLRKLDANTKEYTNNNTALYQGIAKGEALISFYGLPDIQINIDKNKMPFAPIFPTDGTLVITDGLSMVKGAKHPNAAKEFIEFINSKEEAIYQANTYNRMPSRQDILDKCPEWMRNKFTVLEVDWQVILDKQNEWMKYWDENIKASAKVKK